MRKDWIECEAGLLGDLIRGINYKKPQSADNEKDNFLPILRANNINENQLNFENLKYVEKELIKEEQKILVGDIVFAMSSGSKHLVGKSAQAKSNYNGSFGAFCSVFRPNENINSKLIQCYFHSLTFRGIISKASKGSNINNLKREHILNAIIPLPPLPIQKTIVKKIEELFSSLDSGIADLKKAQEQLKVYRQAVLKKAFEGELTKEWREKQTNLPSADELLEQIKKERQKYYERQLADWKEAILVWEAKGRVGKKPAKPRTQKKIEPLKEDVLEKLYEIPTNWNYSFLAFAGDLGRGKSKHRPRNDNRLFDGTYPFIQTGDVKAQNIITRYEKGYSEFGLAQSKLWPAGTLCITVAANIAETGFLGIDACFPDSVVGFTPFNEIISKKYIEFFFQSAKNRISAYAPATAQKNINLTTLENLVVPFCSKKEQSQIVKEIESRLSVCDQVELAIKESLEKAEALRQSILKKAFEGKLLSKAEIAKCKQAKDYEPASVLLERIKTEKK